MMLYRKKLLVIAAATIAMGTTGPAVAKTVKIGVITTYSGPMNPPGISMDKGLTLYAKLHQKDLPPGVKIKIIRRDDTGIAPATAKRLAQELVTRFARDDIVLTLIKDGDHRLSRPEDIERLIAAVAEFG